VYAYSLYFILFGASFIIYNTGWPKKVSHYQIIKKLCLIVLKSDNEFRFLRQIKEMIKHYNIIHRY